jgi:hypothetical protein
MGIPISIRLGLFQFSCRPEACDCFTELALGSQFVTPGARMQAPRVSPGGAATTMQYVVSMSKWFWFPRAPPPPPPPRGGGGPPPPGALRMLPKHSGENCANPTERQQKTPENGQPRGNHRTALCVGARSKRRWWAKLEQGARGKRQLATSHGRDLSVDPEGGHKKQVVNEKMATTFRDFGVQNVLPCGTIGIHVCYRRVV